MNSDQKYWLSIWALVASVIISFIAACTFSMAYDSLLVKELVTSGKDPIEAKCAISGFGGGGTASVICAVKQGAVK